MTTKSIGISYAESLVVIRDFGAQVAKKVTGDRIIKRSNDRNGDLHNPRTGDRTEVKASNLGGAGAIIPKGQLERYCDADNCNWWYAVVYYRGRGQYGGKYRCIPTFIGKYEGQEALVDFLIRSVSEVYVVHISIIRAIFDISTLRDYELQGDRGPKEYVNISKAHLNRVFQKDSNLWREMELNSSNYQFHRTEGVTIRIGRKNARVTISRITPDPKTLDDVSFDPATLEREVQRAHK